MADLAAAVQAATGQTVEVAFVDQGYTGDQPAADAAAHGIRLEVVKLAEAKRGFVLLPRRWVVERSFGWLARFRRLARDYERTAEVLAGWHWVAFTDLMLTRVTELAHSDSLQALVHLARVRVAVVGQPHQVGRVRPVQVGRRREPVAGVHHPEDGVGVQPRPLGRPRRASRSPRPTPPPPRPPRPAARA